MSKNYDGWCLKSYYGRSPWLVPDSFHVYRREVIEQFENAYGHGYWEKEQKKGHYKIVKVKLVEISDE